MSLGRMTSLKSVQPEKTWVSKSMFLVLDKSIFDYMYGMEMPSHLKDPFIFYENATIEISSSNK